MSGFTPDDREKLGEIEQHLVQINGRLSRHDKDIDSLKDDTDWNKNKIYMATGMAIGISSVLSILVQLFA